MGSLRETGKDLRLQLCKWGATEVVAPNTDTDPRHLFLSGELGAWTDAAILPPRDLPHLVLMHSLGLKEMEGTEKDSKASFCCV